MSAIFSTGLVSQLSAATLGVGLTPVWPSLAEVEAARVEEASEEGRVSLFQLEELEKGKSSAIRPDGSTENSETRQMTPAKGTWGYRRWQMKEAEKKKAPSFEKLESVAEFQNAVETSKDYLARLRQDIAIQLKRSGKNGEIKIEKLEDKMGAAGRAYQGLWEDFYRFVVRSLGNLRIRRDLTGAQLQKEGAELLKLLDYNSIPGGHTQEGSYQHAAFSKMAALIRAEEAEWKDYEPGQAFDAAVEAGRRSTRHCGPYGVLSGLPMKVKARRRE